MDVRELSLPQSVTGAGTGPNLDQRRQFGISSGASWVFLLIVLRIPAGDLFSASRRGVLCKCQGLLQLSCSQPREKGGLQRGTKIRESGARVIGSN